MNKKLWNRDFILLCQGALFSNFGAVLYSAAIAYWVYEQTGSTSLMGVLSTITYIILVVFGPFAGAVCDYLRRRNILVITDFIRGLIFLILGFLAIRNSMNIIEVVIAAILSGLCSSLFTPASQTLVPDILSNDELIRGQAIMNGSSSVISMIGQAISGLLLVAIGPSWLILLNGICYILSGLSECLIYDYPSHNSETKLSLTAMMDDFKESGKIVKENKGLAMVAVPVILVNFLSAGFLNLILPYCLQNGMTTQQYGYLGACISAGSLIGMLILSVADTSRYNLMKSATICFATMLGLEALAIFVSDFYPTAVLFTLAFILQSIGNGIFSAVLMLIIPEDKRGLMSSIFLTVSTLGMALSMLIYGFLGDIIDLRTLGTAGALLAEIPIVFLFRKEVQELADRIRE